MNVDVVIEQVTRDNVAIAAIIAWAAIDVNDFSRSLLQGVFNSPASDIKQNS